MVVSANNVEEARIGMYARMLRCPLGNNPEDCPLHEVRKWPIEERVYWLNSRTDEEIIALFALHKKCLKQKLSN